MNAKMVITVPIDDIPEEVSKILEKNVDKLSLIKEKTNNCCYNQDINLVIEEIDEIRKVLSLVDTNLEDCYSVLLGYSRYKTEVRLQNLEKQKSEEGKNNDSSNNG
jgi:hypothetical protein